MTDEDVNDWNQRVGLPHATQLERFGWCICDGTDGEGQVSDDCPKGDK